MTIELDERRITRAEARAHVDAAHDALAEACGRARELASVDGNDLAARIAMLVSLADAASESNSWQDDLLNSKVVSSIASARLKLDAISLEDSVSAVHVLFLLRQAANELDGTLFCLGLQAYGA